MFRSYIKIAEFILPTLLASTEEEQSNGLMYIKPPVPIMTFVFSNPKYNQFWMKNTPSELDIIFSLNNKITTITKGEPNSTKIINGGLSDLVVELPFGSITKLKTKLGDYLGLVDINNKKFAKQFNYKKLALQI